MGNKEKIIPHQFDHERAVIAGSKGGKQAAINARMRKTLAETLRAELAKDAGSGLTKQEYIVAKCLQTLATGNVTPKDLKTMAEVLGELKVNLDVSGDSLIKVVRNDEQAEKLANIGDIDA